MQVRHSNWGGRRRLITPAAMDIAYATRTAADRRILDRVVVPRRLSLILRGDQTVAYNPSANTWHRIDEVTAEVLRWLRAGRNPTELAAHLKRRFPSITNQISVGQKLEEILRWAVLRQLLYLDQQPADCNIRHPDNPLSAVYWICTQACNLRCTYCYQDALVARPNELTTAEAMCLVDQVADASARTFVITGGEPFSRRDILKVAAYAKERCLRVNVITNGHFITPKNVRTVAEHFDVVTVSLDHMKPEHHDRHRGHGSWQRAMRAVLLLLQEGVSVDVNSVLSRPGLPDLKELLRLSREHALRAHRIMPRFPMGRGAHNRDEELTPEELLALDELLTSKRSELDAEKSGSDSIRAEGEYTDKGSLRSHCGAGLSEVSVDPEGWVYPCKLLQYDQFRTGNIRETSLRDLYTQHPIMARAQGRTTAVMPTCRTCIIKNSCGGGCRGIQFSFTEEAEGADPLFCAYLRRSFEVKAWRTTGDIPVPRPTMFKDRRLTGNAQREEPVVFVPLSQIRVREV